MKYYDRAEEAAKTILAAFQDPNSLPGALAPIFIRRKDDVPCRSWSWSNQLLVALHGHSDARGFRQWERAKRSVKKGEKGFPILVPLTRTVEVEDDNGENRKRVFLYGFRHSIIFGLSQTEGESLPQVDHDVARWLESLPLLEVAKAWDIEVEAYSGRAGKPQAFYRPDGHIAVGVKNVSAWCHEMVHAADDKLGRLKERGQHWRSETVAELGAATLLTVLGQQVDADLGGCWTYIKSYAKQAKLDTVAACQSVLKRTCEAVALILNSAEKLQAAESNLSEVSGRAVGG